LLKPGPYVAPTDFATQCPAALQQAPQTAPEDIAGEFRKRIVDTLFPAARSAPRQSIRVLLIHAKKWLCGSARADNETPEQNYAISKKSNSPPES
jgi:hypothetical protein